MATALGGSEDTVDALRRGANDYVTKPFDMPVVHARIETQLALKRATSEIQALARQLEIRNAFIRRTFGRYLSDEIVTNLLETPEGLDIRGEKRRVSILMSDLRGFSALAETLSPVQVVSLLNGYLGTMAEVVQSFGGTVDEFLGDAVLAFFGAPVSRGNDTERAVAAAIAMQRAMAAVNESNRGAGLPEIEMGIGIASGEVIVGNIGSEKRTKYGAVGSPVNLAARIESYTLGGDILICDATYGALGAIVHTEAPREVHPKGFEDPIRVHRVRGIEGAYAQEVVEEDFEWRKLAKELPVSFRLLEGKQVSELSRRGDLTAVTRSSAQLRTEQPLPEFADLRIEILDASGSALPGTCYAKVVAAARSAEGTSLLRFTSRSPALDAAVSGALGSGSIP
jgi:class 3 adenylate cyclase